MYLEGREGSVRWYKDLKEPLKRDEYLSINEFEGQDQGLELRTRTYREPMERDKSGCNMRDFVLFD